MRTYWAGILTLVIIETMALSGCSPFESVRVISSPKSQKSCLGKEATGAELWTKHRTKHCQHSKYYSRSDDAHTTQEKQNSLIQIWLVEEDMKAWEGSPPMFG